eukprot:CAMPEP_0202385170 /NCGR_PEP_ID=MMETSP1127-20130417/59237_1 /ASSEMBLY_ACC=CAM_ASM_000462 /TAXON_ID=3047 /ORGANISM="Dunaliella tertiolecta, Strain CCMP1320" /LENGTH=103 /DNA_ID=CAMNT_0048985233 /DNA_START=749 /DNA_END=1061 /DNA_ORIENTATION=-
MAIRWDVPEQSNTCVKGILKRHCPRRTQVGSIQPPQLSLWGPAEVRQSLRDAIAQQDDAQLAQRILVKEVAHKVPSSLEHAGQAVGPQIKAPAAPDTSSTSSM